MRVLEGLALALDVSLLQSHRLEKLPQSWQLQAVCQLLEAILGNGCIFPFHRMKKENSNTTERQALCKEGTFHI